MKLHENRRRPQSARDEYRPSSTLPALRTGPKPTPEEWRKSVDKLLESAPPELRKHVLQRRQERRRQAEAAEQSEEHKATAEVKSTADAVKAAEKIVKPMPKLPEDEETRIAAEQRRTQ